MADEHLNPKMRRNPFAYLGWEYVDNSIENITQDIDMQGHGIVNLREPQEDQDAATKKYVDDSIAAGGGGGGGPVNAAQVRSTGTNQIQATTVQGAINEISAEAAFIDRANIFQDTVTFNKPPQLAAGVQPYGQQELITLQQATEIAQARQITASEVSVNQNPPFVNIPGTNVQDALKDIDDLFGLVVDFMGESTSLVGTYDANTNQVISVLGGASQGNIQASQPLPDPDDVNKGMYVLVLVGGTPTPPAPNQEAVVPGDIIVSNGAVWNRVQTAIPVPNVNATQVTFDSTAQIAAKTVAGALDELKNNQGNFLAKTGGALTGDLNLSGNSIQNVKAPAADGDAANKKYVDDTKAQITQASDGKYLALAGGTLTGNLNLGTNKISQLGNAQTDDEAVNYGQLNAAIQKITSQLVGKLTFVGTYNANTSQIVSLSPAATQDYQINSNLPPDKDTLLNNFLIVTVAGTPKAPAPNEALNVGDLIYSSGNGWLAIPVGATSTASNVSLAAITQLPGANNVQAALEQLATKQVTASDVTYDNANNAIPDADTVQKAIVGLNAKITAASNVDAQNVTFTSNAGITATNVASALDELKTNEGNFVTKTNGVLGGDLSAGGFKITNTAAPTVDGDASNKKYVDDTKTATINEIANIYLPKTNGMLGGTLDANNNKIVKVLAPAADGDASNKKYVDDTTNALKTLVANTYVSKAGDILTGGLNLGGNTITQLGNGVTDTDAINFGQLKTALLGKVTFIGTYDAQTSKILTLAQGVSNVFPEYRVNGNIPTHNSKFANNFLIVTVGGTPQAPAPTQPLDVGDVIYNTGQDWSTIVISTTRTAAKTSINPIAALPQATNVQTALENLASKTVAASDVSYDNANNAIPGADTVQKAIVGLNTKITDLNATNVAFASALPAGQAIAATNVAAALDELKNNQGNFLANTGGALTGDLNLSGNSIQNVKAPAADTDAANRKYVDDTKTAITQDVATKYLPLAGGNLTGPLDLDNNKITQVGDGTNDSDAINFGQLKTSLQAISSQLIGKLTFVGTYNAQTSKIIKLSPGITTAFPEYQENQNIPADKPSLSNNFLIVTVAGTPQAPAPTQQLDVGDFIYSSGQGWDVISLGPTSAAPNVSVDPINELPGAANVQQALQDLATKVSTPAQAQDVVFTPTGGVAATNVQTAIAELDTEKANDADVVKLTGNQTVAGQKTFTMPLLERISGIALRVQCLPNQNNYMEWYDTVNKRRMAYVGFGTTSNVGLFQFVNMTTYIGGHSALFSFNQLVIYRLEGNAVPNITDPNHLTNKKYVDDQIAAAKTFVSNTYLAKAGGALTGELSLGDNKITNLAEPADATDAANKQYVDSIANQFTLEKLENVDITAAITSLGNKGTFNLSAQLLRDTASKNTISALFGMTLNLTANDWVPGNDKAPTLLPNCVITGEEYFKGLPVPVDTTLTGGQFKTLAQIALISVVPTNGVNLPQNTTPIRIGRLVCAISGGNTQIYIVFERTTALPQPTGTGAFYIMRYEGLPTMTIL